MPSKKKPEKAIMTRSVPIKSLPKGYREFLEDIKSRIKSTQIKAAVRVNSTLIEFYWQTGKDILNMQEKQGWGTQVIEKLAKDLQSAFPGSQGFSRRNVFYMRKFAEAYPEFEIVQQLAALIPWGHNMILLDRLDTTQKRIWYAKKTIENGWSRNMLEDWIRSDLYSRQGKAVNNFQVLLTKPQSDLAEQSLKDPYSLDFLTISDDVKENDIEKNLIKHILKFLVELGKGFAFVGRQVPLRMDDADYYIDLLFFNYKLNCFVVVELKNTAFKPEYAGKMGFYLAAVDKSMKEPAHNRSIGIILCRTKDQLTVEYALEYVSGPIGVSTYITKLTETLPKRLKSSLPTIKEIEEELGKDKS